MANSISMRMAKATDKDMDGAMRLYQFLNAIEDGHFLPEDEDDENWPDFDYCSHADLEKLHEKLMEVFHSGGLMRVLMAASALLNPKNKLLDPDKDYLDDHPRFEQMQQQRDHLLAALRSMVALMDGSQPIDYPGALMIATTTIAEAEGY